MVSAAQELGVSSLHVTFCREDEWEHFGEAGLLTRTGTQYHWFNRGYATFDDYLASLKSSKRKTIRKERARVREQDLMLETLTGDQLTPDIWDAFYPFYRATVDKRWGNAYLTKRFFRALGQLMPERVVLIMARHHGRYVAGALNLLGDDTLYGRVWGCRQEFEFLHFEACYYAAIEFAIIHGLARVEAGAQGMHKLQRGYEPTPTYSAHWIRDPGFRSAVERFLDQERRSVVAERAELRQHLPVPAGRAMSNVVEGLARGFVLQGFDRATDELRIELHLSLRSRSTGCARCSTFAATPRSATPIGWTRPRRVRSRRWSANRSTPKGTISSCSATHNASDRLGLLGAGRFRAAEHPFKAQILVDVQPVNTAAGSGHLPSTALLRRGVVQSRVPPQRRHDLPTVLERYDQVLVRAVNVGDLERLAVNRQNAHATHQDSTRAKPGARPRCRRDRRRDGSPRACGSGRSRPSGPPAP